MPSDQKRTVSIVVPARDEAGNLELAVRAALDAAGSFAQAVELFIIDDGSRDSTGALADRMAAGDRRIRVIHHPASMGLGFSLREGFGLALHEFLLWYPGNNGPDERSLQPMLERMGEADVILSYIANPGYRTISRRFVSDLYTKMLNLLFGLNFKYYNGPAVYRTKAVRAVLASHTFRGGGTAFLAELLIRLASAGCSSLEISARQHRRPHGRSKAFTIKNTADMIRTVARLFFDVRFRHA